LRTSPEHFDGTASLAPYLRYWGKASRQADEPLAFHRLAYHCLDVAAVGVALLEQDPALVSRLAAASGLPPPQIVPALRFLLAIHDLGKLADSFQSLRSDLAVTLRGESFRKAACRWRHDSIGFAIWRLALAADAAEGQWLSVRQSGEALERTDLRRALDPWLSAILGHHGMPPDTSITALGLVIKPEPRSDALAFVHDLARLFGRVELDLGEEPLSRSSWLVAGLTVLCDWVGSNRDWFPFVSEAVPLEKYWPVALEHAHAALAESRLLPCKPAQIASATALFEWLERPSPVQQLARQMPLGEGPQLIVFEEVTGAGKTEAAMLAAQRLLERGSAQGIFVALPTQATANAMFSRVAKLVDRLYEPGEDAPRILSHSGSYLVARKLVGPNDASFSSEEESATTRGSAWLSDHRKKSLLAAVGVGTLDQALHGVLHTRHSTLRLLGLQSKVLIVDEVHAYDSYMARLLERLLEFQAALGGSAILLSATLPSAMRQAFANAFARGLRRSAPALTSNAYPLVTRLDSEGQEEIASSSRPESHRRVGVRFLSDPGVALDRLARVCEAGGCACWVRNSVMDAVEAYRVARGRLGDKALLFHARFTAGDRQQREDEVLKSFGKDGGPEKRAGRLLIATQVVEQSLDLDFDAMVSDLAPVDLLIQRAGRLHRHPRSPDGARQKVDSRPAPELLVLAPEFSETPEADWLRSALKRTSYVYEDHSRLWLTMQVLRDRGAIVIPEEARLLIERVFGAEAESRIPDELRKNADRAIGNKSASTSLAQFNSVDLEGGFIGRAGWDEDAEMPTRLGEPTVMLRLARWDGDSLVPLHPDPLWQLSQVSLRRAYVAGRVPDPQVEQAVTEAEAAMPDSGKWSLTLPLEPDGEGRWRGQALDARGNVRVVGYSYEEGLLID
jgi:CRISPR-associated endonuclease/helicase Cas3